MVVYDEVTDCIYAFTSNGVHIVKGILQKTVIQAKGRMYCMTVQMTILF